MRVNVTTLVLCGVLASVSCFAQPSSILWEHRSLGGGFRSVVVPPDRPIVLAYYDAFRVYDRTSGRLLHTTSSADYPRYFRPIDISADGRLVLATQNADLELLLILRAETGEVLGSRSIPSGAARFSPDGSRVLFFENNNLNVLEVPTLEPLARYRSTETKLAAIAPNSQSYMRIVDGIPTMYDLMTGIEARRFAGLTTVRLVGYAVSGTRIVGATGNSLAIWDAATGQRRALFANHGDQLAMRSGGRYAVTMSTSVQGDSTIRVWDIEGESRIRDFRGSGIAFPLTLGTITEDDRHLVAIDAEGSVIQMDLLTGEHTIVLGSLRFGYSVAADRAGRYVAVGSTRISLYDAATGSPVRTVGRSGPKYMSVSFSADGSRIAVSAQRGNDSHDDGVVLASVATGRVDNVLKQIYAMDAAFSPDGSIVATCGLDPVVKLWRSDGQPLRDLIGHGGWVTTVSFSPDGRFLATGSHDLTVNVWEVATGRLHRTFIGHSGKVNDVIFAPDGNGVYAVGEDGRFFLFAMDSLATELEPVPEALRTVDLSDNGRIAYASGIELYSYDIASGRIIERYVDTMRFTKGYYLGAVVPRIGVLATITSDGDIIAWGAPLGTGVEEQRVGDNSGDALVPNPAHTVVTISRDRARLKNARVCVFDILGRLVLVAADRDDASHDAIQLDVSSLAVGAYWVEIAGTDGHRRHSLRIVR